jgi:hypothetical protein
MKVVIFAIVLVLGFLGLIGIMSGQPILMSFGLGGATFMLAVGSNAG